MDRKFKLAVIALVERHPEIWNFTSEDYKKQDVRLTAWDQIVSELQAEGFDTDVNAAKTTWKRLKDTLSKRLKHYPPGAAKAWVYDDELQFLMLSANNGADNSVTGPEEDTTQDVKTERYVKEGSVTTEDGLTDTSSASVASPSNKCHGRRQSFLRRNLSSKKEQFRTDREIPRSNGSGFGVERLENTPDRFDILVAQSGAPSLSGRGQDLLDSNCQYIAQTLRELSPEVSSMKILEITKVLHTPSTPASNAKMNTTKTSQHNRR